MKTCATALLLTLLSVFYGHSQTQVYLYSCGKDQATVSWEEQRKDDFIYLTTRQGGETHSYVLTSDYRTVSWEYSDPDKGTDIRVVRENGVYRIDGTIHYESYSKTCGSKGAPWYQQVGFHIGYSIRNSPTFRFECIRPDNLKVYVMQAVGKEVAVRAGVREQRIHVRLTGMLSRFFGCDYFIDASTGRLIRYEGVHGGPGTPKTIITRKE